MTPGRLASTVMRGSGLVALVIGLELWSRGSGVLVPVHMLFGALAIAAGVTLGILQARRPGGRSALAVLALVFGMALPVLGIQQTTVAGGGRLIAQLAHVLVAFALIGIGEVCAGRWRRSQAEVK